jgi:hypothetical protein
MPGIILSVLVAANAYVVSNDTISHHPNPFHIALLVFLSLFTVWAIAKEAR